MRIYLWKTLEASASIIDKVLQILNNEELCGRTAHLYQEEVTNTCHDSKQSNFKVKFTVNLQNFYIVQQDGRQFEVRKVKSHRR